MIRKSCSALFFIAFFTVLLLFFCCNSTMSAEKNIAGRVSFIKGTVTRTPKGKALELFDKVVNGDTIKVDKNAEVRILFYSDSHEEAAKGECELSIGEKGCKMIRGKKVLSKKWAANTGPKGAPSARGRDVGASIERFLQRDQPVYPIANVMQGEKNLTFTWKTPREDKEPDARYYLFILKKKEGSKEETVSEKVIETNSITLTEPLSPGKFYRCYLSAYKEIKPFEKGFDNPDNDIYDLFTNREKIPYYEFVMPSRDMIDYIRKEEVVHKGLKEGTEDWVSSSFHLMVLYTTYGDIYKAAELTNKIVRITGTHELRARMKITN